MGPAADRGPGREGFGALMLTRDEANAVIDATAAATPGAVKLACLCALAARIEPELLRALRLEVTRELDAGAEADLWFSQLAAARSSSWMLLVPEIAEALRARRADWCSDEELGLARAVVVASHAEASPLVQLEDELHWLSLGPDDIKLGEKLSGIVDALRGPEGEAVARWVVRTMPRLSSHVRDLPAAWMARLIAEQQLGQPLRIDPNGGAVPAEVLPFLRGAMPVTDVWARIVPGGVELAREPLLGGHRFPAPLTEPLTVDVLLRDGPHGATIPHAATIPRDATVLVRTPNNSQATIRTMDGASHELSMQGTEPREHVTFRWLLMGDPFALTMRKETWPEIMAHAKGPVDAIFFIGTQLQSEPDIHHLRAVIREAYGSTPIFVVTGSKGDVRHIALYRDLPKPPRFRTGPLPGDFAATIEHEGTFIGLLGLTPGPVTEERLLETCGTSLEKWAGAHHVTILLDPPADNGRLGEHFALHFAGAFAEPDTTTRPARLPSGSLWRGPDGTSFVQGELRIGRSLQVFARRIGIGSLPASRFEFKLDHPVAPKPTHPRQILRPTKWVLIAGSYAPESQFQIDAARELGRALATAGYGLATGGWPGIDEEATRGYASAFLTSPEDLAGAIRHYVGVIEPGAALPGRRIFLGTGDEAGRRSVTDSMAVVLIGGAGGTEWMGREALRQQKPLIPLTATGGAAWNMRQFGLPLEGPHDADNAPRQQAQAVIRALMERPVRTRFSPNPTVAAGDLPKSRKAAAKKARKVVAKIAKPHRAANILDPLLRSLGESLGPRRASSSKSSSSLGSRKRFSSKKSSKKK
jgi:hypothetical protein